MNDFQVVWVVEFMPIPPCSVGGFNWYYDFGVAIEEFMSRQRNDDLAGHQTGIYSVLLPKDYTCHQVQEWAEYNCDTLPRFHVADEEEPWSETERAAYNGLSSADYHNPV